MRGAHRWFRPGDPIAPLRAALSSGAILAIPTESSYGLAVDPRSASGVAAIFRLKERDGKKPLPVVVADLEQAVALGVDGRDPGMLAASAHWPAALTVVVPISSALPTRSALPATCGVASLAIRIPAHLGLIALLRELGHGLTATSANRSGEPPALTAEAVGELLAGCDAWIYDGGPLAGGEPSTVVVWDSTRAAFSVLRRGRFVLAEKDLG